MSESIMLEKMSKKELLVLATAHSDFKKSMSREKKEVLIHFLRSHQGGEESTSSTEMVTKDIAGPPLVAPPTVKKTLSRQTKPELLELCQKTPGFDHATIFKNTLGGGGRRQRRHTPSECWRVVGYPGRRGCHQGSDPSFVDGYRTVQGRPGTGSQARQDCLIFFFFCRIKNKHVHHHFPFVGDCALD